MSESNYTYIRQLYYDYLDTDEYNNHPLITNPVQGCTMAACKIFELLSTGTDKGKRDAIDIVTSVSCESEEIGFILGFSYAMNFINEAQQAIKQL